MNLDNWQIQLRKGLLELMVLSFLSCRKHHGYEMVRLLKEIPGFDIREGNIYPILARLQADGVVSSVMEPSPDGPPRKYFKLTRVGRTVFKEMNKRWAMIRDSVATMQERCKP